MRLYIKFITISFAFSILSISNAAAILDKNALDSRFSINNKIVPNYPVGALKDGISATVKINIDVDNYTCSINKINVISNTANKYADLFLFSVENAVKKWGFSCPSNDGFISIEQEFFFNPSEYIISDNSQIRGNTDSIFERPAPEYPRAALEAGNEATLVAQVSIDEHCKLSNPQIVTGYSTSSRRAGSNIIQSNLVQVKQSVIESINKWKLIKECNIDKPKILQVIYHFVFTDEGAAPRYSIKDDLNVGALLQITKESATRDIKLDTSKGICPIRLGFTALQPGRTNLIRPINPNTLVNQSDLFNWLEKLELNDSYKLSLLGVEFAVNIPCAKIDLTK